LSIPGHAARSSTRFSTRSSSVVTCWSTGTPEESDKLKQGPKAVESCRPWASRYGVPIHPIIMGALHEPTAYSWKQIKSTTGRGCSDPRRGSGQLEAQLVLGTPNYSQEVEQAAADPVAGPTCSTPSTSTRVPISSRCAIRATPHRRGLPLFITEFGATYAERKVWTTHHSSPRLRLRNRGQPLVRVDGAKQHQRRGLESWNTAPTRVCILASGAPLDGRGPTTCLTRSPDAGALALG